jgi:SAM-dependent methyltransferase
MEADLPEHVLRNRAAWDRWAAHFAEWAPRAWAATEPAWGNFSVPDADLGVLPPSVAGLDVVELGCGTAYFSAWLARRGARPVGIDNSPAQLATARRMQGAFGLAFPLHLGNAEATPFPDESFDLAISEYGASIWCDPHQWVPEAARILRPGGELIFLVNGLLLTLSTPEDARIDTLASERLERPYFGLHRVEWPDNESVNFYLGYGDWIRLLRATGFEVDDLVEVRAPEGATPQIPYVTAEWARRWPSEEIWKARKR